MGRSERRHPNVANIDELEPVPIHKGSRFGATIKRLGHDTGANRAGCNWFEVPPGKTAFPCLIL